MVDGRNGQALTATGVRDRMPARGEIRARDYIIVPKRSELEASPPTHVVLDDAHYRLRDEGADGWVARGIDLNREGRLEGELVFADGREQPLVIDVSTVE